jgi:hypothetical protein
MNYSSDVFCWIWGCKSLSGKKKKKKKGHLLRVSFLQHLSFIKCWDLLFNYGGILFGLHSFVSTGTEIYLGHMFWASLPLFARIQSSIDISFLMKPEG